MQTVDQLLKLKGTEVFSVAPQDSVLHAIEIMATRHVGALLVMSEARLIGIISERDYARKVILQGRSSRDTPVSDIMTADVVTVTADHTVDECMRIITQHRIRHLPVLSDSGVTGLISIGDLVNSIISAQAETIDHLHTYIHGAAMVK